MTLRSNLTINIDIELMPEWPCLGKGKNIYMEKAAYSVTVSKK